MANKAKKAENAVNLITSSFNANLHIHDTSHITVDVKTTGFLFWKKTEIHVLGRVETDREKEEIAEILETGSGGFTIVNNLRVHKR
ncbi:MAG: hypothetical protein HN368_18075 [Spirochaetales bacterium]|jgi:hypothetical protein|nr:hypothetical protein [Spirochaetales bacterium]